MSIYQESTIPGVVTQLHDLHLIVGNRVTKHMVVFSGVPEQINEGVWKWVQGHKAIHCYLVDESPTGLKIKTEIYFGSKVGLKAVVSFCFNVSIKDDVVVASD